LIGTAVAPLAGVVEITVGCTAVVKLHTVLCAGALPIVSVTPVLMVAV
jgi:hypothetical protein